MSVEYYGFRSTGEKARDLMGAVGEPEQISFWRFLYHFFFGLRWRIERLD